MRNIERTDYREIKAFKQYIENPESVTVLGNLCALYRVLGVHTPWRYPYQRPIARASASVFKDIEREMDSMSSRYLILPKWEDGIRRIYSASLEKNYFCIASTENFELWEAVDECYK